MMILIAVLVGLSIGGLWFYMKRPVAMRVDGPAVAAQGAETAREAMPAGDPAGNPDAQPGSMSVSRAPSAASQLRESLLATEVVEVGFDDQVASDLREGRLDRAIFLIRQLIQIRPDDADHRLRLFSLLYAEGRCDEFVREAIDARQLKPPLEAHAWLQVCEWGSQLDPGNKLFAVPGPRAVVTGEPDNATAAPRVPRDKAAPEPNAPGQPWAGAERRKGKDRRVSNSPWLGVERRKGDRRRSILVKKQSVLQAVARCAGKPAPAEPASPVDPTQEKYANG